MMLSAVKNYSINTGCVSTNLLTVITFNFPLIWYNLILKQYISYNWSDSHISPMSCLSISSHLISKMTYCNSCWDLLCFSFSHFLHLLSTCKIFDFKTLKNFLTEYLHIDFPCFITVLSIHCTFSHSLPPLFSFMKLVDFLFLC